MTKTQYEQDRDANVRKVQETFNSLGIPLLAREVREVLYKKEKGKAKTVVSDKKDSDNEYDPHSDIENQSDSDDSDADYDDDLNNEVQAMVPGTRPQQKKQKAAAMAAANKQPPCSPIRFTRQSAAMPSPRGRPPPKQRLPLPPKTTNKANTKPTAISSASQQQGHLTSSGSLTTQTTNTMTTSPTTPTVTRTAMSAPVPNPMPSPPRYTRQTAAMSSPGANPTPRPMPSPARLARTRKAMSSPGANTDCSTPGPTLALTQQPTPATSVNQTAAMDTSPGGQSSRQSNDINDSCDQFEAAISEDHTNEGEPDDDLVPVPPKNVRKKTMGHGLEKMISRGNKLTIQEAEGKKRPEVPLQAAKLASETGVAVRDSLPIYTSWKLYEKDAGLAEVAKVLDKVVSRLDVDVKNEGPSKFACTDIIKKGVRQQRYHLKRKYYDESLSREQHMAREPPGKMKKEDWVKLVDYWCDPKNQEKSSKNKVNRGQVQLHQRTGSRSYVAHRYSLRPKYNNMDPDPVDFFGECMTSPKIGRTPLADEIYEQMVAEKEREPEEGEAEKSPSKIVADNLSQISHSSTFLLNIGVPRASKTGRSSSTAAQALMQAEFEATLQAEREEAARKQAELQAQIQAQQAKLEENQTLLLQTQEEVKEMHSKFEENNTLLRAVLKLQKD